MLGFEDEQGGHQRQFTLKEKLRAKHPPNQSQFSRTVINHLEETEDRKYEEVPNFNAGLVENEESPDFPKEEEAILIDKRKTPKYNTTKVPKQNVRKRAFMIEESDPIQDGQQQKKEKLEEQVAIHDLNIRKKKLEIELIELDIKSQMAGEKMKFHNISIKDTSSKSVLKMAAEENKEGSFEYFDQQDLDSSEFFRNPDQQDDVALKLTNNRRSNRSASRAQSNIRDKNLSNRIKRDNIYGQSRPSSAVQAQNQRQKQDPSQKNQLLAARTSFDLEYEESEAEITIGQNNRTLPIQEENLNVGHNQIHIEPRNPDQTHSQQPSPQNRSRMQTLLSYNRRNTVQINPSEGIIERASESQNQVKLNQRKSKADKSSKEKRPKKQKKKGGDGPDNDGPGSYPMPMEMLGNFEEADELNFFEPISYAKLEKVISQRHPVDPETKSRFLFKDRITITEYEAKLSDLCFCYAANLYFKEKAKFLKKLFRVGGPKKKLERPPSMKDIPESNSSSGDDDTDGAGGLTQCSIALGEGATLYLQMMKTLSIMFIILTIMNIPLFCFYEQNTHGNQLGNLQKVFKYFTLGNLGQMDKRCSWSTFEQHFNSSFENEQTAFVDCGKGYIGELQEFGFLYQFDKLYGGDSVASERCKFIENPLVRYKKPSTKPICTQEQLIEIDKSGMDRETQTLCKIMTPEEIAEAAAGVAAEIIEENPDIYDKNTTEDIEIQSTANNVDPECEHSDHYRHNENLWSSNAAEHAFMNWFDKECYYKQNCTFDPNEIGKYFDDSQKKIKKSFGMQRNTEKKSTLFQMVSDDCKSRMNEIKVTSYQYIAIVGCKYDDVRVPFSRDKRLHKEWIGTIILICDILSILMMYYFFSSIRKLNLEVLEAMDDLLVQMKDFGIKIDDVKLDRYTQDSRLIKMKIWLHFTRLFQNRYLMSEYEEYDSEEEEENQDEEICNDTAKRLLESPKMGNPNKKSSCFKFHPIHQVLDVCLSIYTQPSIQCVFRMQDLQLEINEINNKLRSGGYQGEEIPDKQDELKALIEKQKRFEERYNQLTKKKKQRPGQTMTVERVSKSQRLKEIQYIFVIFKNCETAGVVHMMYPQEKSIMNKQTKDFELFGKQPKVVPILEPDEIIWENLAYSKDQQQVRRYIIQVISIIFLLGNTLFTMYLSGFKFYLNSKIPALNCDPELTYTKIDAYKDQMKIYGDKSPTGLLACYCSRETSLYTPWNLIPHNFAEFRELIPEIANMVEDNKNYCAEWQLLQIVKQILMFLISTSAVFINEIVADIFQQLGQFQKKHTKIEEQILCFRQIFSQEYINMGIVILVTSFDNIGIKSTLLGDLAGQYNVYTGFDPNWYMDYGNKICVMIFMSSFVVNSKDVFLFIRTVLKRFRDRSFNMNLKLDPEDEGCDQPNTKLRIQSELEALYTGKEFKGEKAYSRMMSTMFVILMYSSGMPILYFAGAVFYIVTFLVNKFLLINFYQKSRTLTRTIPLFAIDFMQYALFMHSFISLLMLTNPIAFKTRSRTREDGTLLGVDPPMNVTSTINQMAIWLQSDDQIDEKKLIKSLEENPLVKILESRLQFFHQQMFLAFLVTYIIILFLGKTIYGIFYLIWIIILKLIKAFLGFLKRKAKEAKQRVEDKIKLRQLAIKKKVELDIGAQLGLKLKQGLAPPTGSAPLEVSQNDQIFTRMDTIFKKVDMETEDQEKMGINIFQQSRETEAERAKREKQEQRDQKMKDRAAQKKLKRADYSDNILSELSCENLSNFYQRCKRERQDFWEIFRWEGEIGPELLTDDFEEFVDHRTLFLETLYTYRILQDDVIFYQIFLNERLKEIEQFVDKYFDLFKPRLLEKMQQGYARDRQRLKKLGKEGTLKDQVKRRKHEEWALQHSDDVQFDDLEHFPYDRKLKILTEYQEDLIFADKDQKDNRQGIQQICRMAGSLAQSYFIFDSYNYKVGRKIYFSVVESDDDEEEDDIGNPLGDGIDHDSSSSSSSSSLSQTNKSSKTKLSKVIKTARTPRKRVKPS